VQCNSSRRRTLQPVAWEYRRSKHNSTMVRTWEWPEMAACMRRTTLTLNNINMWVGMQGAVLSPFPTIISNRWAPFLPMYISTILTSQAVPTSSPLTTLRIVAKLFYDD
jgi:hypothetical protein